MLRGVERFMGDSFYSPDPLLVELQNWKGEELPGETGLRSIQIYLPEGCAPTFGDVQLYLA